jgi:hypothetical protein
LAIRRAHAGRSSLILELVEGIIRHCVVHNLAAAELSNGDATTTKPIPAQREHGMSRLREEECYLGAGYPRRPRPHAPGSATPARRRRPPEMARRARQRQSTGQRPATRNTSRLQPDILRVKLDSCEDRQLNRLIVRWPLPGRIWAASGGQYSTSEVSDSGSTGQRFHGSFSPSG